MKSILLDADGVVIEPRNKYFSDKYSEEYNVPLSYVMQFFKNEYKKAVIGEISIRKTLPRYFEKWGWEKSVDEFLRYWFESEQELNNQLLNVIDEYRQNGIPCYLVSDNEEERARYIMEDLGLKNHFDEAFFSFEMGMKKNNPDFFIEVVKEILDYAEEVIYWDDDPGNVTSAKEVGINAFVYQGYQDFIEKMKNYEYTPY